MARAIRDRRRHAPSFGIASVELAAVLPFLVAAWLGVVEVVRMVQVRQILSNAAREGGRQASTGQIQDSEVAQVVRDYVAGAGLPVANLSVDVSNLTSAADSTQARQLDQLRVVVGLPYRDVRLVNSNLLVDASAVVTSRATWFSLKDRPYPAPPEPPIE